jgi:hypothetical protein
MNVIKRLISFFIGLIIVKGIVFFYPEKILAFKNNYQALSPSSLSSVQQYISPLFLIKQNNL